MSRLDEINSKVVHMAGKPLGPSEMRIPGMKIGSQLYPNGPTIEDLLWMSAKLIKCKQFLESCSLQGEELDGAKLLIREIEE